ncbi:hypothetical protein BKA81DRAFT_214581 [Phyllosticta paracitricarpa]
MNQEMPAWTACCALLGGLLLLLPVGTSVVSFTDAAAASTSTSNRVGATTCTLGLVVFQHRRHASPAPPVIAHALEVETEPKPYQRIYECLDSLHLSFPSTAAAAAA